MLRTLIAISLIGATALSGFAAEPVVLKFLDFNDGKIPVNKDGAGYPNQYAPDGTATVGLDDKDAVAGRSLRFEVTRGVFYAQFNAHNPDGSRGFAREYVSPPDKWKFGTLNRLSFWVQSPPNGRPLRTGGQQNMDVGTYVKRVEGADTHSDETGGGHWYHMFNIAPTGTWTRVIVNMHPHHLRGQAAARSTGTSLTPRARRTATISMRSRGFTSAPRAGRSTAIRPSTASTSSSSTRSRTPRTTSRSTASPRRTCRRRTASS